MTKTILLDTRDFVEEFDFQSVFAYADYKLSEYAKTWQRENKVRLGGFIATGNRYNRYSAIWSGKGGKLAITGTHKSLANEIYQALYISSDFDLQIYIEDGDLFAKESDHDGYTTAKITFVGKRVFSELDIVENYLDPELEQQIMDINVPMIKF